METRDGVQEFEFEFESRKQSSAKIEIEIMLGTSKVRQNTPKSTSEHLQILRKQVNHHTSRQLDS